MTSFKLLPISAAVIAGAMPVTHAADMEPPRTTLDFNLFAEGRYVYERNCIVCHGKKGDGNGELSKELQPKPRSFREGWFKFRSTPWDKLPTEDDLRRTITGGLSGTAMGMFTQLTPEEVTAVIEYVKSFSRRWRKAENYAAPVPLPASPKWLRDPALTRAHATTGKILFNNVCATCHGTNADGKGPTAPALKDMWGLPSPPADLRQPHLRCGDNPADIFRTLTTGLSGTSMLSFAQALTEDQRWDIVAYISTIRLPSGPVLGGSPKSSDQAGGKSGP